MARRVMSGARRKTNWESAFVAGWVSVAVDALHEQQLVARNDLSNTLVRTRGNIAVMSTSAAGVRGIVGIGIAAVSDRARIIGTTALPRPLLDGNDDVWLWHTHVPLVGGAAADDAKNILSAVTIDIDSKAMRKLPDDQVIVLVLESSLIAFRYMYGIRSLVKLP